LIGILLSGLLVLALLATLVVIAHLHSSSVVKGLQQRKTDTQDAIQDADAIWDAGQIPEAVASYKRILRDHSETLRFAFVLDRSTAPRLFRRVIDYELKYGDKGDARDYMTQALNEFYLGDTLSLDSSEGRQMLDELRRNREAR